METGFKKIKNPKQKINNLRELYSDLWNNIMSEGKNRKKYNFLGCEYKAIENKNITQLYLNSYKIQLIPKNCKRFLMLIGNKIEKGREIVFIDEEINFWEFEIRGSNKLPPIPNTPQILFDGWMHIDGNVKYTEDKIINGKFTYLCTDILYGPTNPIFQETTIRRYLELGSSAAYIGPKGGSKWLLNKRYSMMKKLLTNKYSILNLYNIKNIYNNLFCFICNFPLINIYELCNLKMNM